MYNAIVQRVQRFEVSFTEKEYKEWAKWNAHVSHTHESFVKDMAESVADVPEAWNTYEQDIICIIYNPEGN